MLRQRFIVLQKAEESKKKDLERKMLEQANMTQNIKCALEDYVIQKKEINLIKKQEQEFNLNKRKKV